MLLVFRVLSFISQSEHRLLPAVRHWGGGCSIHSSARAGRLCWALLNERFECFSLCYDGSFIHLPPLALELLTGNPKGNLASRQRKCMVLESVEYWDQEQDVAKMGPCLPGNRRAQGLLSLWMDYELSSSYVMPAKPVTIQGKQLTKTHLGWEDSAPRQHPAVAMTSEDKEVTAFDIGPLNVYTSSPHPLWEELHSRLWPLRFGSVLQRDHVGSCNC